MSYLKEHDDHVKANGYSEFQIVYLESFLGLLQIDVCADCPYVNILCEHKRNSWNEEETQLTCNLCGIDGT